MTTATSTLFYFGFGSLVNELTLPAGTIWHKASLRGWRRCWRHPIKADRSWAAMDVIADSDSIIEGLLLVGGGTIDDYLLQRESGYRSIELSHRQLTLDDPLPIDAAPSLWTSKTPSLTGDNLWLMQSYVDVVMSGYLRNFGEAGLQRFIDSTDNWHLPTIDDRDAPRYPRSITLNEYEHEIITSMQPSAT